MDYIDIYIKEDLGSEGDITSDAIFDEESGEAVIVAKDNAVIAGLDDVKELFSKLNVIFEPKFKDGEYVSKGEIVAMIRGRYRDILAGERIALNMICRMSGIATETRKLVEMCKKVNPNVEICATRKTTPGFRKYEKKAVVVGGGISHRFGLFDAVLIKDNHIKAVGSIREAILRVKRKIKDKFIEVEVENEEQAIVAAKEKVDAILIDNQSPDDAQRIARKIRETDSNILIEISGGINEKNILRYASFADRVSIGYITHSIKSKDFSLEIVR